MQPRAGGHFHSDPWQGEAAEVVAVAHRGPHWSVAATWKHIGRYEPPYILVVHDAMLHQFASNFPDHTEDLWASHEIDGSRFLMAVQRNNHLIVIVRPLPDQRREGAAIVAGPGLACSRRGEIKPKVFGLGAPDATL